jgi:hypothetical protein
MTIQVTKMIGTTTPTARAWRFLEKVNRHASLPSGMQGKYDVILIPVETRAYVPSPLRGRVWVWVKCSIDYKRRIQRFPHPLTPSLRGGGTDAASARTREVQV